MSTHTSKRVEKHLRDVGVVSGVPPLLQPPEDCIVCRSKMMTDSMPAEPSVSYRTATRDGMPSGLGRMSLGCDLAGEGNVCSGALPEDKEGTSKTNI